MTESVTGKTERAHTLKMLSRAREGAGGSREKGCEVGAPQEDTVVEFQANGHCRLSMALQLE